MMTLLIGLQAAVALSGPASGPPALKAPAASAPIEFPFEPRSIYPLVAAPGRITDIVLEPGERLVEINPIAAGDTARWVIGDTTSGQGEKRRVHVLVKPTAHDLSTNLVINTDRRTYLLDLRASSAGFLSQLSWRYPQPADAPVLVTPPAIETAPAPALRLNFNYRVTGRGDFRPKRVYDDGARTYLDFPSAEAMGELPPVYAVGEDGKAVELINSSVEGRTIVIDRLVDRLELRMGMKGLARSIRITRVVEAVR